MANFRKSSVLQFGDLPDEVILQVLHYLDFKDLANCVTVSKRIRSICGDVKIFQKINLCRKRNIPKGFVQLIMNSGKYYSLIGYQEYTWYFKGNKTI